MMNNVLLHIDERDFMNGKPDAPYMIIRSEWRAGKNAISAQCNNSALELYSDEVYKKDVTRLSIPAGGLTLLSEKTQNHDQIEHITVTTSNDDKDISALKLFPRLKSVSVHPIAPIQRLVEVAPKIQYATVGKKSEDTISGLNHLRGLQLLSGLGRLDSLTSDCLETLFIGDLSKAKFGVLKNFLSIKTLYIRTRAANFTFDVLSSLPNLENFAFDGPSEQQWRTLPTGLRKVSIEKTNNTDFVANHLRQVPIASIGFNPRDRDDEGFYRGNLLKSGDPFRDIETEIFEGDISI